MRSVKALGAAVTVVLATTALTGTPAEAGWQNIPNFCSTSGGPGGTAFSASCTVSPYAAWISCERPYPADSLVVYGTWESNGAWSTAQCPAGYTILDVDVAFMS
jgi:hypothetical protein